MEPAIEELLTTEEVAGLAGLTKRTIGEYRTERNRRFGPPFHRDGARVFYRLSEVLRWVDGRPGARLGRGAAR
jgi:predicted DNA-binding transcriptional regulator AlpA